MCLLTTRLHQCRNILSPLPSCFYIASLWQRLFLWVGRRGAVFAPFSLCLLSQRLWRSRQIILLPLGFLLVHLQEFDVLTKFVMSWIDFSEIMFINVAYPLYLFVILDTIPKLIVWSRTDFLSSNRLSGISTWTMQQSTTPSLS